MKSIQKLLSKEKRKMDKNQKEELLGEVDALEGDVMETEVSVRNNVHLAKEKLLKDQEQTMQNYSKKLKSIVALGAIKEAQKKMEEISK